MSPYLAFQPTTDEVEENEKNRVPSKKRNVNKKKICLSTFLHHLAKTTCIFSAKIKH